MPDQLLTIFRLCFLVLLYLFFFRVLRAIWTEVNAVPEPLSDGSAKLSRKAKKAIKNTPSAVPVIAGGASAAAPQPPPSQAPSHAPQPQAPQNRFATALRAIDPPNLAGLQYTLVDAMTFGRGGTASVILDDTFMSTSHLRIRQTAHGWIAEDLNSTNGTYLNRVRFTGSVELSVGDQLQLGNVVLEVI